MFVFHCVSVHHCPGLLRGSKEHPAAPTVHNPAFAPAKKATLPWSCSLQVSAGTPWGQERTEVN